MFWLGFMYKSLKEEFQYMRKVWNSNEVHKNDMWFSDVIGTHCHDNLVLLRKHRLKTVTYFQYYRLHEKETVKLLY